MIKKFQVASSDGVSVYVVSCELDAGKLYVYCDCQAGGFGKWCKHKAQVVLGELPNSRNSSASSDISTVLEWVNNTQIAELIGEIQRAEDEIKKAKTRIDQAKKILEKVVKNGA